MSENQAQHLTKVQGRAYLPVDARIVAFREDHPEWAIETEVTFTDDMNACIVKCSVKDETGRVLANGHKKESSAAFADFVEKAETGAIGRALKLMGYGTLNALNEAGPQSGDKIQTEIPANVPTAEACVVCGTVMTAGQAALAMKRFGKLICGTCQKGEAK